MNFKTFHRAGSGRMDAQTECSNNSEAHCVILGEVLGNCG